MKKTLTAVGILLLSHNFIAQNPTWIMPPKYVDANTFVPYFLPIPTTFVDMSGTTQTNYQPDPEDAYDGQVSRGSANGISDASGNLLFFIVDGVIYNGKGEGRGTLPDYTWRENNYAGQVFGSAETVIVPDPANCNRYYITSIEGVDNNIPGGKPGSSPALCLYDAISETIVSTRPWFSLNTINLNHGLFNYPLVNGSQLGSWTDHYGYGSLAATKKQADGSYFIVNQSNIELSVARVTTSGSYGHFKYDLQLGAGSGEMRTIMEIFEDPLTNEKTVVSYHDQELGDGKLSITKLSANMDAVINHQVLIISKEIISASQVIAANAHGLEFSPNGQYLYITHNPNALNLETFGYVDLANPTSIIPINVPLPYNLQYSEMELTKGVSNNDILVFAHSGGLVSYSNPNSPGTGSFQSLQSFSMQPNYSSDYANNQGEAQKYYLLPDQIDGMNYNNIFQESVACCLVYNEYDKLSYTATVSATWQDNVVSSGSNPLIVGNGNVVYIKDELRIQAGNNITIKNMTIRFAPGARLVIEQGVGTGQGGKLVLEGTTLSVDDRCGANLMWLGVEVWGNQANPQNSWINSTQGRLELKPNSLNIPSVIEHAYIGALASQRYSTLIQVSPGVFDVVVSPFSYTNSRNGGMIKATNSKFFGNRQGVYFGTYNSLSNNLSGFKNTIFEWNGLLKDPSLTIQHHVRLIETKGIRFEGCDFTNVIPNLFPVTGQGIGIFASNSTFFAGSTCPVITAIGTPCPSPDMGSFTNLYEGILVSNGNLSSFTADLNNFNNCVYGTMVFSARNEVVTNNIFKVREALYETAGLVMHNSTFYTVEGNEFFEFDDLSITDGTADSYGIVVDNSGNYDNEIYRNKFHNLKVGGQTERINGTAITTTNYPGSDPIYTMKGLKWICNDFVDNVVLADLTLVNGRMNYDQGHGTGSFIPGTVPSENNQAKKAALNKFSMTGENPFLEHDIMLSNSQALEYSYIDAPRQTLDSYTPNVVDANQILWNFNPITTDFANTCPVKTKTKTKGEIKNEKDFVKLNIDELKAIIDKGNTTLLIQYITTWNDKNAVKNKLLEASPYLSDEVLITYINSNPPVAMLKQVMIENSKLSNEVRTLLDSKPLPIGTRNQINAVQVGVSERTKLIKEIHYQEYRYSELLRDLLAEAILDTTETAHVDSVVAILIQENDQNSKELLLEAYILKGDNSNADLVRSELLAMNTSNEMIILADVQRDIRPLPATSWALENNPNYRVVLENLKNNSSDAQVSSKAKSILEMVDGADLVPEILDINNYHAMMIIDETQTIENNQATLNVSMYPNPTNGLVYFDYPNLNEGFLTIQLYDLSGKEIYSYTSNSKSNGEMLDLSNLNKGLFMVKISIENEFIEIQKLLLK